MSRGSSEFVIEKDNKYGFGITVFGDTVEVERWVAEMQEAETLYGSEFSKTVAKKVGGMAINIGSEYAEYEED